MAYFANYEVDLVCQRKAQRLWRKRFWAAGVNDLFAVDQHDKWLRFGLALNTGIEPFSGRIMWMRVWHSNRNPQLILTYYLETIQELGRKLIYKVRCDGVGEWSCSRGTSRGAHMVSLISLNLNLEISRGFVTCFRAPIQCPQRTNAVQ
jgi:hypothetical protein